MPLASFNPIGFIPISNAEAARKFYEQTLGLTFVSDDKFAIVFRVGPHQIMLRIVRMPGEFTPAHFTVFGWEVPDVHAAVSELSSKGVTFERYSYFEQDEAGVWNAPDGAQVAWFKDPDGNTLSLSHHGG